MAAAATNSASEVEETLARIRSHNGVEGVIIMNREGATLQTTLSEEQTAEHAAMLSQLTSRASNLVRDLDPTDELSMLRVRSRNREIMIAPDKEFILIVIQNPHIGESS
eukprot:CAMPEP_0197721094 /NCGR_PEP_ID=MMETSP1434-20131217/4259_1 /TAXON_ID=265543 /ORGANISM="Minutocellus polymorphus, Strain CCMP3303" /LENGTH=108 /DNA_ID=CAMNT_0043306051 /DNA_START=38 /DNA_END=364 /DNA_ORIENTATION=-